MAPSLVTPSYDLLYLKRAALLCQTGTQGFSISLILAVISRYLTFAWVTPFMHVLATVGHKVSNYRKYGILRAAEEVVRAGVLSYAPGSESVHMFHLSHFHRLVSFCWFGFGCWGGFVCFAVAFFLSTDQSVRSSCQPMTSLAYLHDCHSRYDERSFVQKKKECLNSSYLQALLLLLDDELMDPTIESVSLFHLVSPFHRLVGDLTVALVWCCCGVFVVVCFLLSVPDLSF